VAVADSKKATVTLPSDREILITREFDGPRNLVYQAWTTPELVKRWWSGHRGKVTSAEIDLRVGGRWRYVMVANGGFEVAFHGEYREIVPDERIVSTEVYELPEAPEAEGVLNVVTFTEADGRTTLTILVQAPSAEVRDAIMDSGMEVGMQEQMELLEQLASSLR
jgi:uncharacterized protein YndB with AHSA1/START domain